MLGGMRARGRLGQHRVEDRLLASDQAE